MVNLDGTLIYRSSKKKYIKLKRNQLLILDALLNDGGYVKKYIDKSKKLRFSEHSGYLGLNKSTIDRLIVSTKTSREDKYDTEILLPYNLIDTYNYEYLFHTHPPTPKIGGRANEGILYEFPSVYDIFHFIDHYNMQKTIGSIVIAAEGIYIIYAKNMNKKKITYDIDLENDIIENIENYNTNIQIEAINKYGIDFTDTYFYTNIAKDATYLKMYNKIINKYLNNQIKIIIKNREKDLLTNSWLIKSLYLKI